MYMSVLSDYLMCGFVNTDVHVTPDYLMCGYIHADVNMNLGGPAKVKCESKSREL